MSEQKRTTWRNTRLRALAIVLAVPYFAGVFIYAPLPSCVMFLSISLPDWFRLVMVGVATVGISFLSWAYCVLGKNWGPSVSAIRKGTVLVTSGPYNIVMHPVYLRAFIFLAAIVLVSANLLVILPMLVLLVLLYRSIDEEEALLLDRFGDEYSEYMKRTPPDSSQNSGMNNRHNSEKNIQGEYTKAMGSVEWPKILQPRHERDRFGLDVPIRSMRSLQTFHR